MLSLPSIHCSIQASVHALMLSTHEGRTPDGAAMLLENGAPKLHHVNEEQKGKKSTGPASRDNLVSRETMPRARSHTRLRYYVESCCCEPLFMGSECDL